MGNGRGANTEPYHALQFLLASKQNSLLESSLTVSRWLSFRALPSLESSLCRFTRWRQIYTTFTRIQKTLLREVLRNSILIHVCRCKRLINDMGLLSKRLLVNDSIINTTIFLFIFARMKLLSSGSFYFSPMDLTRSLQANLQNATPDPFFGIYFFI